MKDWMYLIFILIGCADIYSRRGFEGIVRILLYGALFGVATIVVIWIFAFIYRCSNKGLKSTWLDLNPVAIFKKDGVNREV